jgi:4-hydroxythreonine-4-phosphate dehydrogenase
MNNKLIAITMGDPSGIGPEIIISALEKQDNDFNAVVIGCPNVIKRAIKIQKSKMKVHVIKSIDQLNFKSGTIEVLEVINFKQLPEFGTVNSVNGKASYQAIISAIKLAMDNHVSGIVTSPINKESLALANIQFPGHTEILAEFSKTKNVAMMLVNNEIKTVLSSIHCSLSNAIKIMNINSQISSINFAYEGAHSLGIDNPRIAVAGLNPHAGERGLFGQEEIDIIIPAIKSAKKKGINVSGPWPGDTVFMQARKGEFDIVVAQYHDQGLIPIKYMGLESGVNITLGLPFVRTSPDHGTAYNIAGKGVADSSSLEAAIKYAIKLIVNK